MSGTSGRTLLIGCGVLRRELELLIGQNAWDLDTWFIDSSLHVDLEVLSRELEAALALPPRRKVVCYGVCHPRIDQMIARVGAVRTPGQNCVELLLGPERFTAELACGAFFLLEEWALRWDEIIERTFGDHPAVIRDIFREDRTALVGVRTPCSGDFREAAEAAGHKVGLPVRWLDAGLEHLEGVLAATLDRAEGRAS